MSAKVIQMQPAVHSDLLEMANEACEELENMQGFAIVCWQENGARATGAWNAGNMPEDMLPVYVKRRLKDLIEGE